MTFLEKLSTSIHKTDSRLCIGLDPRPANDEVDLVNYLSRIITETAPHAAAFKPNIAYFEALGPKGYSALEKTLSLIPNDIPVILDCKRSDIPETQKYYAKAYFENWNVDAVTLNPFLGFDSIEPFLNYEEKGVYLLAITSNPGAEDFLTGILDGQLMLDKVQELCARASAYPATAGLVIGLTNVNDALLSHIHDLPLLIPGFGAQGGNVNALRFESRRAPILINASRSIIYGDPTCSYEGRAEQMKVSINSILKSTV